MTAETAGQMQIHLQRQVESKTKLLERCSFCDGLSEHSPFESLPGVNLRDEGILRFDWSGNSTFQFEQHINVPS